jgi:hypothetical protein
LISLETLIESPFTAAEIVSRATGRVEWLSGCREGIRLLLRRQGLGSRGSLLRAKFGEELVNKRLSVWWVSALVD